jgi:ubiquinone/menaquinone biosynthesis C-methylase UbiE
VARIGSAALVATAIAWLLPIAALGLTLRLAGTALGFDAVVRAFATGTLLGGATGLPLGVSVVGSTMIRELHAAGVALDVGVLAVLVHRIGTAWYAVFLGVASFLFWRRRLAGIVRDEAPDHFDDIARVYEELIPRHVRDRLLAKKTGLIRRQVERLGAAPNARGLDLGCGQGWYMAELARAGHVVYGVDAAHGQLVQAAAQLEREGIARGRLLRSDMTSLPFPDACFDFVYSINALHHLADPGAQQRALREIARVLRPRGVFVLHELNTANPVFRLYMSYVFPLLNQIDEGTEHWILPWDLPPVPGAEWQPDVEFMTFTPDFAPAALQPLLDRVERRAVSSAPACDT